LAEAAGTAVDFVRHHLWRDGRLLATFKDGRAHLPAYLDDYAFLADALLELLQTRWRSSDLEFARQLADVMLHQFEDAENGGFFFTAKDHEQLIHRSKTFGDESVPSGNGVAASMLCRLGYLLGETRYLHSAERTLRAAWAGIQDYPQAHMSLVNALQDSLSAMQILVIRGEALSAAHWASALNRLYAPTRMIYAIPNDAQLPAALAAKRPDETTVAYLCTGMTCSAPLANLEEVARTLKLPVT
jgi:hypothetical protein